MFLKDYNEKVKYDYNVIKKTLKYVLNKNTKKPLLTFKQPNPKSTYEEKTSKRYASYMTSKSPHDFFANQGKFVDFIWDLEHEYVDIDLSLLDKDDIEVVVECVELHKLKKTIHGINMNMKKTIHNVESTKKKTDDKNYQKYVKSIVKIAKKADKLYKDVIEIENGFS
jgi:hypothetical protein